MRLVIRAFGLDLLDVELSTAEAEAAEEPQFEPIAGLGAVEATPISFESRPIDSRQTEAVPSHDPWEWKRR